MNWRRLWDIITRAEKWRYVSKWTHYPGYYTSKWHPYWLIGTLADGCDGDDRFTSIEIQYHPNHKRGRVPIQEVTVE